MIVVIVIVIAIMIIIVIAIKYNNIIIWLLFVGNITHSLIG